MLQVAAVGGDARALRSVPGAAEKAGAQPEEYYRFFNALPWFSDPALVKRTLEFALSPTVRSQDTGTLIGALLVQPWSSDLAWEFTKTQWPTLLKTLGRVPGDARHRRRRSARSARWRARPT